MEQPTEPGFYWARGDGSDGQWWPVEVALRNGELAAFAPGDECDHELHEFVEWGPRIEPPGSWNPNRYASTTYTLVRCPKCGETADKTVTRSRSDAPR